MNRMPDDVERLEAENLRWQDESLKNLIRAGEAEAALAERDRMLAALIDAHYGMSFHHIGDGDGLTADEAAEIRTYAKLRAEEGSGDV
jgi:hypothetical protein